MLWSLVQIVTAKGLVITQNAQCWPGILCAQKAQNSISLHPCLWTSLLVIFEFELERVINYPTMCLRASQILGKPVFDFGLIETKTVAPSFDPVSGSLQQQRFTLRWGKRFKKSIHMCFYRIGWNGDRRNMAFSAENRNIVPPLEMTMNVFLSR